MLLLRGVFIVACLLVVVVPRPALAAPTLTPDFYLPTQAELPPGFTITSAVAGGAFAGAVQGRQEYYGALQGASGYTVVLLSSDHPSAASLMVQARTQIRQLGWQESQATRGDESIVAVMHGAYAEQFFFAVRSGLVVAYTVLSVPVGRYAANDAGYLTYTLTAPMWARMAAHPDGV